MFLTQGPWGPLAPRTVPLPGVSWAVTLQVDREHRGQALWQLGE